MTTERGAAVANAVLILAALCLVAALAYPTWERRSFRALVNAAVADVDAVEAAAEAVRSRDERWPGSAPPGEVPTEMAGFAGEMAGFVRDGYTLEWRTWEVVDSVEITPDPTPEVEDAQIPTGEPLFAPVVGQMGGIVVHAGSEALLAELLERFSGRSPFVLDTTWTLILPERAEAP